LPPSDDKWIAGNSYLYDGEKVELMKIDTSKCGWFTKTYSSSSAIPERIMIYLGSQGTADKLDSMGKGADISNQAWIPLRTKFGTGTVLSLTAENMQYSTTAPVGADLSRCSYKMAAFIYDTDNSVNPSFNGTYVDPGTANSGLRRGIVKPDLDPNTRKPTYAQTGKYANWVDAESFNAAFIPYGLYNGVVSNIPRCYDMPFGRATNGTWEFDSDIMRPPVGNNIVGGFFPYILDSLYSTDQDGTNRAKDYADSCSTCNKEYTANCSFTMNNTVLNTVPNVNYKGTTYSGLEAFNRTYLDSGWSNTAPYNVYNNAYTCTSPRPGYDGATKAKANLSFCFESHGEFAYEKGQEFFFRGDDDIWVFINNRLVIDLGGLHNPAPGYVDLDTIKTPTPLVEGERYPIDIFFCERMGTQSNVRISTNMYIVQKSTFYSNPEVPEQVMCVSEIATGDCASRMNSPTSNKPSKYCGEQLTNHGYKVEFYIVPRGTQEKIVLSPISNPKCSGPSENAFACYGGIKVENTVYSCGGAGQCKGNEEAIKKLTDLPGSDLTVYARLMRNGQQIGNPINIDNIRQPFIIDAANFYMINHDTKDTVWLSIDKNPENCKGPNSSDFACYGGIKINSSIYSCGGESKCEGNAEARARIKIAGNFDVYNNDILLDKISETTPILNRHIASTIKATVKSNAILLENLPKNTKVEIYNLQGKRIHSTNSGNSQILKIPVQTKGIYIVKLLEDL